MAMKCISGASECTGCMACQDEMESYEHDEYSLHCDDCGETISNGSQYCLVDNHIICLDCIDQYWRVNNR